MDSKQHALNAIKLLLDGWLVVPLDANKLVFKATPPDKCGTICVDLSPDQRGQPTRVFWSEEFFPEKWISFLKQFTYLSYVLRVLAELTSIAKSKPDMRKLEEFLLECHLVSDITAVLTRTQNLNGAVEEAIRALDAGFSPDPVDPANIALACLAEMHMSGVLNQSGHLWNNMARKVRAFCRHILVANPDFSREELRHFWLEVANHYIGIATREASASVVMELLKPLGQKTE